MLIYINVYTIIYYILKYMYQRINIFLSKVFTRYSVKTDGFGVNTNIIIF